MRITRREFVRGGVATGFAALVWAARDLLGGGERGSDEMAFAAAIAGSPDDTAALQALIDRAAEKDGLVTFPEGVFMIDALRSLHLRSDMVLRMTPETVLRAIPTPAGKYAILSISNQRNVRIHGGVIEGDRAEHPGDEGEWGMGISVLGSEKVTLEGVTTRDCWGDGIYIGNSPESGECREVVIRGCTAENNRRQGLSIVGCIGGVVADSSFIRTHGTGPASGIDLEPNAPYTVRDVEIVGCRAVENAGRGIKLDGGSGTLEANIIRGNYCAGNSRSGIEVANHTRENTVLENRCEHNGRHGIQVSLHASRNRIVGNTCEGNSQMQDAAYDNIYVGEDSDLNLIERNTCRIGTPASARRPRYGIHVATADCEANRITNNRIDNSGARGAIFDRGTRTVID